MSGKKVLELAKPQTYRFDFGTDGKLYAITFHGMVPQEELNGMLASVQNCLYHKMSEIIPLFLRQRHLENSNFASFEIPLAKDEAMDWATAQ